MSRQIFRPRLNLFDIVAIMIVLSLVQTGQLGPIATAVLIVLGGIPFSIWMERNVTNG